MPHPDTLYAPLPRDPTPLTTRMEVNELASWASRRAAIACYGEEPTQCCPTNCLPLCGTYDPACQKACSKACMGQLSTP